MEGDDAIHVTANTSLTGFAYLMPTIIVLAMIVVALFVIGCLSFELDVRVNQWSTNPTLQYNGSIDNLHSHNFLYTWFGYCCASYGKQKL